MKTEGESFPGVRLFSKRSLPAQVRAPFDFPQGRL